MYDIQQIQPLSKLLGGVFEIERRTEIRRTTEFKTPETDRAGPLNRPVS